jgi:hypothetical protein
MLNVQFSILNEEDTGLHLSSMSPSVHKSRRGPFGPLGRDGAVFGEGCAGPMERENRLEKAQKSQKNLCVFASPWFVFLAVNEETEKRS